MARAQHKIFGTDYGFNALSSLSAEEIIYNKVYAVTYPDGFKVTFQKKRWGGYELYLATTLRVLDTIFNKYAIVGNSNDTSDNTALMLANSNQFAYVSDEVTIKGECYVPNGMFKPYHTAKVPDVKQYRQSPEKIPALRNIDSVVKWLSEQKAHQNHNLWTSPPKINNSFSNEPLIISADTANIDGVLEGNIIITARTIFVKNTARLSNIILIGGSIFFEAYFKGQLQCYASDTITTGKRSLFVYPSILGVIRTYGENLHSGKASILHVEDSTEIQGDIFGYQLNKKSKGNIFVNIEDESKIIGGVYSSGYLKVRGQVFGRVICTRLLENINNTVQENLLYKVELNNDSLPYFYTFSTIFPEKNVSAKVIKWVQ